MILTQYRNKNAYYNQNLFYSYNALIAVNFLETTFYTSTYYSNTTSHHKTDAKRLYDNTREIRVYNGTLYKLQDLILTNPDAAADYANKIINQYKEDQELTKILNGENTPEKQEILKKAKKGQISIFNFKNGNKLKTTIKTYKGITFKEEKHYFRNKNGRTIKVKTKITIFNKYQY